MRTPNRDKKSQAGSDKDGLTVNVFDKSLQKWTELKFFSNSTMAKDKRNEITLVTDSVYQLASTQQKGFNRIESGLKRSMANHHSSFALQYNALKRKRQSAYEDMTETPKSEIDENLAVIASSKSIGPSEVDLPKIKFPISGVMSIEKHRGTFQNIKTNDVGAFFLQKSFSQRNLGNTVGKSPYAASPRPRIQVKQHFS